MRFSLAHAVISYVVLCCCVDTVFATTKYYNPVLSVQIGVGIHNESGGCVPVTIECVSIIRKLEIRYFDSDGTLVTDCYDGVGKKEMTVYVKVVRKDRPIHIDVGGARKPSFVVPVSVNTKEPFYLIPIEDNVPTQRQKFTKLLSNLPQFLRR